MKAQRMNRKRKTSTKEMERPTMGVEKRTERMEYATRQRITRKERKRERYEEDVAFRRKKERKRLKKEVCWRERGKETKTYPFLCKETRRQTKRRRERGIKKKRRANPTIFQRRMT